MSAHSNRDLIAALKSSPGKFSYGLAGVGNLAHLAMELFKLRAGGLRGWEDGAARRTRPPHGTWALQVVKATSPSVLPSRSTNSTRAERATGSTWTMPKL